MSNVVLSTTSDPSPTPLPGQSSEGPPQQPLQKDQPTTTSSKDTQPDTLPLLRIHFDDLSHPATAQFLSLIDATRLLPNAITTVLQHLYPPTSPNHPPLQPPVQPREVRSITLVLRPMSGVAATHGLRLDPAHKEIHLSLDYIRDCATDDEMRRRAEIIGVATHEAVHCLQHDASGTAPGGLIEGIADYVRLKAGLAPPHWAKGKRVGERWDEGYQRTAFFLEWMEREEVGVGGKGAVARINRGLAGRREYQEEEFWREVLGMGVGELWRRYVEWDKERERERGEEQDGNKEEEEEKNRAGTNVKASEG